MAEVAFNIEINPNGSVKIETGDMSGPHHASADKFYDELIKMLGGPVEVKKKQKSLKQKQHKHVHVDGSHDHHHHN
jgi:hypothetical protein